MSDERTYRVIALLLLLAMKLIRSRTRRQGDRGGERQAYQRNRLDTAIMFSLGLLWPLSIVIYSLAPQWISWAALDLANWLRCTGVALGLGSLGLLAWSDRHLAANFSPTLRIRENHQLVQSGPYRWIRHPIYTSGAMFFLATWLVTSNWLVGLCWSGVLVLYAYRIPHEERMMLDAFGDEYTEYMNRTGRLLPRFHKTN